MLGSKMDEVEEKLSISEVIAAIFLTICFSSDPKDKTGRRRPIQR